MENIKSNKNLILSKKRITEIENFLYSDFDKWRALYNKIWQNNICNNNKTINKINFREPSWKTFATANPVMAKDGKKSLGVRGCVAFHKIPCMFKKKTQGSGCSHCALSIGDKGLNFVPIKDQIFAVKSAIAEITKDLAYTPPIIEILPDGSFSNENEVFIEAQEGILKLLSKNKSVLQVSIESRPEYISSKIIRSFLNLLRDDQILEVYVGLESADPFVLNKIIKKGFTVKQFERKIKKITDSLSVKEKARLRFSVYHFFKPPYLTEKESIDSAIFMAKKVKKYEKLTGVKFSLKYEPAVISVGTFQKYLFDLGKYIPPSYFSVAEVIGLLYQNKLSDFIKFGQRDDIDDYQTVAGVVDIKNPMMFCPFDFMVYNAVQRFNAEQDVWGFCADMSIAIENAFEFKKWEEEIYGGTGKSSLSYLHSVFLKSGLKDKYKKRMEFQRNVWKVLDEIEYDKKQAEYILEKGKECEPDIKNRLSLLFLRANIKILQFKNLKFIDIGKSNCRAVFKNVHADFIDVSQSAVYQIEIIIENEVGLPQSVWVKIPLNPVKINLNQFDFIYSFKSK